MAGNAQCADHDWKAIDQQEKEQDGYNGEDEATQ